MELKYSRILWYDRRRKIIHSIRKVELEISDEGS